MFYILRVRIVDLWNVKLKLKFADDTNILVEDSDENALKVKTESVMKQLEVWFLNNELILNIQNLSDVFSF